MAKPKNKEPLIKKRYSAFEYNLIKNQLDRILKSPEWEVACAIKSLVDLRLYENLNDRD